MYFILIYQYLIYFYLEMLEDCSVFVSYKMNFVPCSLTDMY